MAEALGVVASGIAVAQLAGNTLTACLKLKQFWDQIEGSEGTIQDLVGRIECLGPALRDAEQTFGNPGLPAIVWDDAGAQMSIRYFQKALQSLKEVVYDLAAQVGSANGVRKAVGKVKAGIKKQQLEELDARLTRAESMLQRARLEYMTALLRQQPDIIVAKVQTVFANQTALRPLICAAPNDRVPLMNNGEKTEDTVNSKQLELRGEDGTAVSTISRFRERRHLTNRRQYSRGFIPPLWLAGWMYAWNLTLRHSYSGWDANIRYYSIRPDDSLCFMAAWHGDLELLKRLMSTGEARLDDQDVDGMSLLQYSIWAQDGGSVTEYLLNAGARADQEVASCLTPANFYFSVRHNKWTGAQEMQNFQRVKAAGLFSEHLPDYDETTYECYCPFVTDASNFQTIQAVACPWHTRATLESKLDRARLYIIMSWVCAPAIEVVKQILSPEEEGAQWRLFADKENEYTDLLHHMASYLVFACLSDIHLCPRHSQRNSNLAGWTSFLLGMLPYCQSLHHVRSTIYSGFWCPPFYQVRGTPLTWALAVAVNCGTRTRRQNMLRVLQAWLSALQQAGIDLCEYGAEENTVLSKDKALIATEDDDRLRVDEGPVVRLLGFKVGPGINDWDVRFIEPFHDYSSDFWALIEGSPVGEEPLNIPGAWIEEDS